MNPPPRASASRWWFRLAALPGLAALWLLGGCAGLPALTAPPDAGPAYQPRNFSGDAALPATLRRVVLLPVCAGPAASPETAAALDQVLLAALQKQARFEVVTFSREQNRLRFGAAEFSSVGALPAGYVAQVAAECGADAVLFVDLTVYQPYRPLATGFRAKLATAAEVRLVWTFDEVISAADPGVARSARRQYARADRSGEPVDLSATVLQSPGRFTAFAAAAMFSTLPPR